MVDFARVDSIDALRALRAALAQFVEEVGSALTEASVEIQNAGMWLRQEQQGHWKLQERKRAELLNRAKLDLMQKQHSLSSASRSSCVDEKKALAKARRLHEEATQKIRNVKRWMRDLDDEAFNFKGQVQSVRQAIEIDLPRAMAALERMAEALQAYTAIKPVTTDAQPGEPDALSSMARPVEIDATQVTDAAVCRTLRDLTPTTEALAAAIEHPEGPEWLRGFSISEAQRGDLDELDIQHGPIAPGDLVVFAETGKIPERLYMQRRSDGGWYAGFADGSDLIGLSAMRGEDVFRVRPDWRSVLALPAGCVVILRAGAVEAVFDDEDRLIWPGP